MTPIGIKPRQARILNALSRMGEVSQNELAEQFDVTSGSMSTMIERLEKVQLIERRKNPDDRRVDLITLSKRGALVLTEIRDVWCEIDELIEEKLGSQKFAQLSELTKELKFAMGGKIAGMNMKQNAKQR